MTRILLAYILSDPRMDTAQVRPSSESTVTPGTQRSASGIEVAPDLRISSAVSTNTAAGDLESCCALRPTEVTCTLNSSSTPTFVKSSVGAPTCCAHAAATRLTATSGGRSVFIAALSAGNGGRVRLLLHRAPTRQRRLPDLQTPAAGGPGSIHLMDLRRHSSNTFRFGH